jgi:hypothetical protein
MYSSSKKVQIAAKFKNSIYCLILKDIPYHIHIAFHIEKSIGLCDFPASPDSNANLMDSKKSCVRENEMPA